MKEALNVFAFFLLIYQCAATCIWYGQGKEPSTGHILNIAYDGDAKILTDGLDILESVCPNLYRENHSLTCCDSSQLLTLKNSLAPLRQFVIRCPACDVNLRSFFCDLTCHPNQSEFLTVTGTSNVYRRTTLVTAIDFAVSYNFVEHIIDSCRGVKFSASGDDALKIICSKSAELCTPAALMEVFSSNSPFSMNITLLNSSDVSSHPLNDNIYQCNESFSILRQTFSACSCSDCSSSCPSECPFKDLKKFLILNIDGFKFVSSTVALLIICIAITTAISKYYKGLLSDDSEHISLLPFSSIRSPLRKKLSLYSGKFVSKLFENLGYICCKWPSAVICLSVVFCSLLCCGVTQMKITTDPVILWSSKNSRAYLEKNYYDTHFRPFYRMVQLFIVPKYPGTFEKAYNDSTLAIYVFGNVLKKDFLKNVSELQTSIMNLTANHKNLSITLNDICYKPQSPANNNCSVLSVLQYFQNDPSKLDLVVGDPNYPVADWSSHFIHCSESPLSALDPKLNIPCLGDFGGPVRPYLCVGGFPSSRFSNASALIITILLDNYFSGEKLEIARKWELKFIEYMKNYSNSLFDVFYSAERSIQDEIDRESKSDVLTISISYFLMFLYVTVAIAKYSSWKSVLVDMKVTLAFMSVCLVLMSVVASIGLFSYFGVSTTLLIFEVIPFLILAIGVDNIFIMVQCYQNKFQHRNDMSVDKKIISVMRDVGPGIFFSGVSQVFAFSFATMSSMYAVKLFASYASVAIILNLLLQITFFVSLLYLDAVRQSQNRIDVFCCLKIPYRYQTFATGFVRNTFGLISRFLFRRFVRLSIFIIFMSSFVLSLGLCGRLNLGLDSRLSMPHGSYVIDYLNAMDQYLQVGPPFYFVVKGNLNYSSVEAQNLLCGGPKCSSTSLLAQLSAASEFSNISLIEESPSSWLDGYYDWILNPLCCRIRNESGEFCPSTSNFSDCVRCPVNLNDSRIEGNDFIKYLPYFLKDNPSVSCPFGGHALFGDAVELLVQKEGMKIESSYFMGYHSPLRTSQNFTYALRRSWQLADNVTKTIRSHLTKKSNVSVFSYSVFYIYYEQYLTLVKSMLLNLFFPLLAVFIVSLLVNGFSLRVSFIVICTILMILVDLLGVMAFLNIELNAVTVVNLVMSIGISVEFCAHLIRHFIANQTGSTKERASHTFVDIGSSVFSGIFLTKLIGIFVLAFSKSQLFTVYFFRMYLSLVIIGGAHGLFFLPVLLSFIGPKPMAVDMTENEPATNRESSDESSD